MINILVSYVYSRDIDFFKKFFSEYGEEVNLILDSGAFTAYSTGKPIELKEYCLFLDKLLKINDDFNFVHLDVIGDEKQTLKNLETMKKLYGERLIGVITNGSSLETIEKSVSLCDYLAIGGIAKHFVDDYVKHLLKLYPEKKFHGLGYVRKGLMDKGGILYSADASSWMGTHLFGGLRILEESGNVKTYSYQEYLKNRTKLNNRIFKLFGLRLNSLNRKVIWGNNGGYEKSLDRNLADLASGGSNGVVQMLTTFSYILFYDLLEKKYSTRCYFACQSTQLYHVLKAYRWLKQKGYKI